MGMESGSERPRTVEYGPKGPEYMDTKIEIESEDPVTGFALRRRLRMLDTLAARIYGNFTYISNPEEGFVHIQVNDDEDQDEKEVPITVAIRREDIRLYTGIARMIESRVKPLEKITRTTTDALVNLHLDRNNFPVYRMLVQQGLDEIES